MVWFAFVRGPLGPDVRLLRTFIYDFNSKKPIENIAKIGSLLFRILNAEEIPSRMDLIKIDPDVGDLIRLGYKDYTVAKYF